MNSDITPHGLRELASEWHSLDAQASLTEAEMVRYDKMPQRMAMALQAVADWRDALERQAFGDMEATRDDLLAAVDAGANQVDIQRLNNLVWKLFHRASALRLTFRRLDEANDALAARDALLRKLSSAFGCKSGRDGACSWPECPQERDGEPARTRRHCPGDIACGDPHCDAMEFANRALAAEINAALKGGNDE